jgi:hypothetical protein
MTWRSVWSTRRWPVLGLLILASPVLALLALQTGEVRCALALADLDHRVHFGLVIPLWCLIAFGSFIRDEVQAGTIGFLLTRPLTRSAIPADALALHAAAVQVPLALNTILLGATAVLLRIPNAFTAHRAAVGRAVIGGSRLWRDRDLSGIAHAEVSAARPGVWVCGRNWHRPDPDQHQHAVGGPAFSDLLEQFELIEQHAGWSAGQLCGSLGGLLLLTLVYLGASLLLFNVREYSQSEENEAVDRSNLHAPAGGSSWLLRSSARKRITSLNRAAFSGLS